MWSNFHTHTAFCDGKKSITETAEVASNNKIYSLGFSSHAPLPFHRPWCMKPDAFPAYLHQIAETKRKSSLQIYSGLEVDFIPGVISIESFQSRLDYTIGSIHFVEKFHSGDGWEIDGPHAHFLDGLREIFHGDIRTAVERYFELTREMILHSPPDIVGHLDKIKIQNTGNKFFHETDPWYRQAVRATLQVIEKSGCIVEVNTRGLYQNKSTTSYPSPWILEELLQRSIPITLSSDAHHPDDLTGLFSETARVLLGIGFKNLRILLDGRWQHVAFNEHGLQLNHTSYYPMA